MDDDLICNYKKCRKRLNSHAWVSTTYHPVWNVASYKPVLVYVVPMFPSTLQVTSCSRILLFFNSEFMCI